MKRRLLLASVAYFFLASGGNDAVTQAPNPEPNQNPEGNTGALKAQIATGGSYAAHSGNGTRIVEDLQLPGALGVYGLDFTRYWNSLPIDRDNPDASPSTDFGAAAWSYSWMDGNLR